MVRFKYGHEYYLRRPLADWLAEAFHTDPRLTNRPVDAIVPVPLHPRRERERTFNQAAVLARLLARRVSLPVWPVLRRVRYTEKQAALARSQRLENLRGAFASTRRWPAGKRAPPADRRRVYHRRDGGRMRPRAAPAPGPPACACSPSPGVEPAFGRKFQDSRTKTQDSRKMETIRDSVLDLKS